MTGGNPYRIDGPALISFSGGRTSGYMLWHILDAHNGDLPDDVYVCFANTGKEREETLRFVHECATRWGVRIRWLEWRHTGRGAQPADRFEEVGYNSASRNGEPFEALIAVKRFLPNSQMRYCTEKLKVDTMKWFMRVEGYKRYLNAIGLRWDEMHRVFKQMARNEARKDSWETVMPMATRAAQVTRPTVEAWWKQQPFDLQLRPHEGNCDLCFLKGRAKRAEIIREHPEFANWWIEQETLSTQRITKTRYAKRFDKDESYEQLRNVVLSSPRLPLEPGDDAEHDAECGLWCAGEAA
jgi:3'-phosphoadenosine 5'-phosphosulfate sulfotransferase (PAPS reductase)/FAD synthetase